jgi:hypothetical protein
MVGGAIVRWQGPGKRTSYSVLRAELVVCRKCLGEAEDAHGNIRLRDSDFRCHPLFMLRSVPVMIPFSRPRNSQGWSPRAEENKYRYIQEIFLFIDLMVVSRLPIEQRLKLAPTVYDPEYEDVRIFDPINDNVLANSETARPGAEILIAHTPGPREPGQEVEPVGYGIDQTRRNFQAPAFPAI